MNLPVALRPKILIQWVDLHINRFDYLHCIPFVMADMAAIAMAHLDGVIQREKQLYIQVHDRPKNNRIDLMWRVVFIHAKDGVADWYTILFRQCNRLAQFERACDINFNGNGSYRKLTIVFSVQCHQMFRWSHQLSDVINLRFDFNRDQLCGKFLAVKSKFSETTNVKSRSGEVWHTLDPRK